MEKPNVTPLSEEAARLIAEEEAKALEKFRARDIADRVRRAIAAEGTSAPPRAAARRVPGWAWAAGALLTSACVLAYLAVTKGGPAGGEGETARAMALRLPGLDGLDTWAKDGALAPAPSAPAAGGFAAALAGLRIPTEPGEGTASEERIRPPRLGLEKLMEILIRDRAVEKALSHASPKFKEG